MSHWPSATNAPPPPSPGINFTNILLASFCTKMFCVAFLKLQFGFVIFWQKNIGAKAALKILVKLTPGFCSNVISVVPSSQAGRGHSTRCTRTIATKIWYVGKWGDYLLRKDIALQIGLIQTCQNHNYYRLVLCMSEVRNWAEKMFMKKSFFSAKHLIFIFQNYQY